jgi:hypothetical protein
VSYRARPADTPARGHYCPKEHQQHLLAAFYPQIAAYTQIATISTDDYHTSQEFRASIGAQWPFLSIRSARCSRTSILWSTRLTTTR